MAEGEEKNQEGNYPRTKSGTPHGIIIFLFCC